MENLGPVLSSISPIIALIAGWLAGRIRSLNRHDRALEDGVKMLLRATIMDMCLKYISLGKIPPYALEMITGLYSAYTLLGDGDRSIGDLVERTTHLNLDIEVGEYHEMIRS